MLFGCDLIDSDVVDDVIAEGERIADVVAERRAEDDPSMDQSNDDIDIPAEPGDEPALGHQGEGADEPGEDGFDDAPVGQHHEDDQTDGDGIMHEGQDNPPSDEAISACEMVFDACLETIQDSGEVHAPIEPEAGENDESIEADLGASDVPVAPEVPEGDESIESDGAELESDGDQSQLVTEPVELCFQEFDACLSGSDEHGDDTSEAAEAEEGEEIDEGLGDEPPFPGNAVGEQADACFDMVDRCLEQLPEDADELSQDACYEQLDACIGNAPESEYDQGEGTDMERGHGEEN